MTLPRLLQKAISLLHNILMLPKTALADKYMIVKERLKLVRAGVCDKTTNTLLDSEGIYNRLNDDSFIIWPVGISPHGKWGPIFHNHLTGKQRGDY